MPYQFQNNEGKVYTEMIKSMMMDYVVNDMTQKQLCDKYKITPSTMTSIFHQHKFREKKASYQDKVLQKSLDKMATRQSSVLNKLTLILERQVNRLEKQQLEDPTKLISPERMKEILNAFNLISKEYRLDNGKPTDNNVTTIKVDMGSTPIISENHIVNADIVEVEPTPVQNLPTPEEVKVVVETQNETEDDPIFGSID